MKLSIFSYLLIASALLQGAAASAQIRGEDRDDHNRPGGYEDGRNNGGGYNRGGGYPSEPYPSYPRHDDRPAPYPGDRPAPYPGDRPAPYPGNPYPGNPNPYPRPEPRPYPGPQPYPGPRPYPAPQPYPGPRPYPGPQPYPGPRPYPGPQPYPGPNPYPPSPYPNPGYPGGNYSEAKVQFSEVTRRMGGEWLRVNFNYPAYIDYATVELYRSGIRIHEAYAVTESGRRIYLSNLSYGGVVYAGQKVMSEYISAGERIAAIDIRAESMGGCADVTVGVVSRQGYPSVYPSRY
ncbi:MAG: beta-sandwich domain-containing protein [Bdellovibrio sp.]